MSGLMRVIEDFASYSKKGVKPATPQQIQIKAPAPVANAKSVKLSDNWVLWSHHINDTNWDITSYSQICELSCEDDFFWLTKNLPALDDHILYLMRKGIVPIWEDPKNRNGGCFSYKISKKFYREIWNDTCKALMFDYLINDIEISDTVTGISINPRTNTLKIWNGNKTHNQQSYINPCVKGVDFKGCMYKPHQIDETRRVESGFRGSNETGDVTKSTDQKVGIILQRITALMSKLVKTNLLEFSAKLKKMEEMFGEEFVKTAFERYQFINSQNDNEYMYIKLKLRMIYSLNCKYTIYKMMFDKMISRYYEIMKTFKVDEDLTPKNIADMEEAHMSEEDINRNVFTTSLRNELKCICVAMYYYIHIGLLENKSDFWTDIINNTFSETLYNPYLIFDGIMRLIIMIRSKLPENITDLLKEYKSKLGTTMPRKIRFAIDDVCQFISDGKKSPSVIELHEVYED
jgi:hypothetical protein